MNILDEIVLRKREEVEILKSRLSVADLESQPGFLLPPRSMRERLLNADPSGIIAEFKRRSPSRGVINSTAQIAGVAAGYESAGAAAISVLTDEFFFGGNNDDLIKARLAVKIPILRKEFIVDPIQVTESKALGADVILLIAAILKPEQTASLIREAHRVGLEVLLEVHDEFELEAHQPAGPDFIGVNNRNLRDFTISHETSIKLAPLIRPDTIRISESGIGTPDKVIELSRAGYRGFLMGEHFMKTESPAAALGQFISELKAKRSTV